MSKKTVAQKALPSGWWPDFIPPLTDADFVHGDHISVAEISNPAGPESYRQVYTALVPPDLLEDVLRSPGGIGSEVDASGPHPCVDLDDEPGDYKPRFWIHNGDIGSEGLEPLVLSWQSANRQVLIIDPGFLMTYALVPRSVQVSAGQYEFHWDNLEEPKHSVVISHAVSVYDFPLSSPAWVRIRREYLEDYAFLLGKALVHVFYIHGEGTPGEDTARVLARTPSLSMNAPGMRFAFYKHDDSVNLYKARVWGTRLLLRPATSPLSAGRWDYGELIWPGYTKPFTHHSLPLMDEVFVSDAVLGEYEGREGFSIVPEHGSVSYGSQWAVSYIRRVGRDLLAVEARKLYEGTPPSVVKVWHSHAVPKPPESPTVLRQQENVATRARILALTLLEFGEVLAVFQTKVLGQDFSSLDTVGLDRGKLRYSGWWKPAQVEPITRHLPINMPEDKFLERCEALDKLVNESFRENGLRRILCALGCSAGDISEFKSLRLLDRLLDLCRLSIDTGLNLIANCQELERRRSETRPITSLPHLIALKDLRNLKAHKTDSSYYARLDRALEVFCINRSLTVAGWGGVADRIYDALTEEIKKMVLVVSSCI